MLMRNFHNAAGQKVRKTVDNNDGLKIVDYLDGFQYAGSVLQFFPTAEGYVKATRLDKSQTELSFNYIYNYTDHLGNVRVSYTLDPQTGKLRIVDEHHYYPFGLRHEVHYPSGNRLDFHPSTTLNGGQIGDPVQLINVTKTEYMYKFNGKELQDELGLDWYDYHARNYDPAIGRWMNIDPLSEVSRRWSPYTYVYDNPLIYTDPDGMKAELIIYQHKNKKTGKTTNYVYRNGDFYNIETNKRADYRNKDNTSSHMLRTRNGINVMANNGDKVLSNQVETLQNSERLHVIREGKILDIYGREIARGQVSELNANSRRAKKNG